MADVRPRFRQQYGIDPMREWIRRELPGPRDGLVVIDLDLAVRRFSKHDPVGDLLLCEKKEQRGKVTEGEARLYGWLDDAISKGPHAERWRGVHLLRLSHTVPMPTCPECGAPRLSPDAAFEFFLTAELEWDNKPIDHDGLRRRLLGQ